MNVRFGPLLAAAVVLPLLLAARLPASDPVGPRIALPAAALVAVAAVLAAARRSRWASVGGMAACAVLLAVPRSSQAWLQWPAALNGAAAVILMLQLYEAPAAAAPRLGNHPTVLGDVHRWVPIAFLAVLLAGMPWLASRLLPARIGRSYELHGAPGILLFVLLVAACVATIGLARIALAPGAGSSRSSASVPPATGGARSASATPLGRDGARSALAIPSADANAHRAAVPPAPDRDAAQGLPEASA